MFTTIAPFLAGHVEFDQELHFTDKVVAVGISEVLTNAKSAPPGMEKVKERYVRK